MSPNGGPQGDRGAPSPSKPPPTRKFQESESPAVTLHRRLPEGGFTIERHSGLDAVIPLPEIDASLSLAELYERVEFPS